LISNWKNENYFIGSAFVSSTLLLKLVLPILLLILLVLLIGMFFHPIIVVGYLFGILISGF